MDAYEIPDSAVSCVLTDKGEIDTLKHGHPVANHQAVFWVESNDPLREAVFALDPDPVHDDAGVSRSVLLQIGRPRIAVILNERPVIPDERRKLKIQVWRRPAVEVRFGPPTPIDACGGLGDLLALEAAEKSKFFTTDYQTALSTLDSLLLSWRGWVAKDGIRNATILRSYLADMRPDARAVTTKMTLDQLGARLKLSLAWLESTTDDDSLDQLMQDVEEVFEQSEEVEETVEQDRRRLVELDKAARWVMERGSPRLRKAVQAELLQDSLGAYRDERLEAERPGWRWWRKTREAPVKSIVNPSEEDLDALLAARELDPGAYLAFHPDEGPVVIARYLDRHIIRQTRLRFDGSL